MKTVTRYQTIDGREFISLDEATDHENLVLKVRQAMKPLGPIPSDQMLDRGWIQHNPKMVLKVKVALLKLARSILKGFPEILRLIKTAPEKIHPQSIVGRILSESQSPVEEGWYRIGCIDAQGREHNQPYFAINGPAKDHVCVEDRS